MAGRARALGFDILPRTRLGRYLLPSYIYMFSPSQLAFLVQALDETASVEGALLEVGCFQGATTLYLNEHLRRIASEKRYFALDTFAGFPAEDVEGERRRGRADYPYENFRRNSVKLFRRTMVLNQVSRVSAVQVDAKEFDYSSIGPFSFSLIDVDLYESVPATLEAVYQLTTPGGIIVVDDCNPEHPVWRGAYEAYFEFVESKGEVVDIRHTKLGVIRR